MLELEQHVEPEVIDKIASPSAAYEISQLPKDSRETAIKELAAEAGKGNITARMVNAWKEAKKQAATDQMPKTQMEQQSLFDDTTGAQDDDAQVEVLTSESNISTNAILVNPNEDTDTPEQLSQEENSEYANANERTDDAGDDDVNDAAVDEDAEKEEPVDEDADDEDVADEEECDADDEEYEAREDDEEEDDTEDILHELRDLLRYKLARRITEDEDERNREELINRIKDIEEDFWSRISEYIQFDCE